MARGAVTRAGVAGERERRSRAPAGGRGALAAEAPLRRRGPALREGGARRVEEAGLAALGAGPRAGVAWAWRACAGARLRGLCGAARVTRPPVCCPHHVVAPRGVSVTEVTESDSSWPGPGSGVRESSRRLACATW